MARPSPVVEGWSSFAARKIELIAATMFGDAFLEGGDGVWFLDMLEGELTLHSPEALTLERELNTPEGEDQYLFGGLVAGATERGVRPGTNEVLESRVHPRP